MSAWRIITADVLGGLAELPAASVQVVVTSPPYWGLRDYGVAGQIGLEDTPEVYLERMVEVFEAVRRVLRTDGTVWLNMGDCYSGSGINDGTKSPGLSKAAQRSGPKERPGRTKRWSCPLKPKDLCGMPWRLALALQAAGWYLRSDIIWAKPNPMPESVTDRPTKSHEYLFLLAHPNSGGRYFYDADAIREPHGQPRKSGPNALRGQSEIRPRGNGQSIDEQSYHPGGRNLRSVWTIPTQGFPDAHFSVYPEALVEPCVKAGSRPGDTVLDPFTGSGTTGVVAARLHRRFIGIELSSKYSQMAALRVDAAYKGIPYKDAKKGQGAIFP